MNTSPPRLLLIDGSGFIFRAYHKLPPLSRADGTPTNAVYGFTSMMLKLRETMPASHAVVVFDAKGKTFRHDFYSEYKSHRPAPPEDLLPQLPLVREAAIALGLAIIEQDGMEADDIMASYATCASAAGLDVCIISSDKDMMQMLSPTVSMFDPMKNAPVGEAEVFAKFGVTADKVVEVQALIGDSSDNIPGIKGIGVKTAAELILRYGTVENLLAHTHEIPQAKRRELLEAGREAALISKHLATLKRDCTDLPPFETYAMQPIVPATLKAFCEAQGFKSLVGRIKGANAPAAPKAPATSAAPIATSYHLIQTMDALEHLLQRIHDAPYVAFDVETTSLDTMSAQLVGISLCLKAGEAYYLPLAHKTIAQAELGSRDAQPLNLPFEAALAALKPMLEDPAILKIGHNIKYDCMVMARYGITVAPYDDTMLLSYLLSAGASAQGMDALAEAHLGITPIAFKDVTGTGKTQITFDYVALDKACAYAAEDADITLRLYHLFKPQILEARMVTLYERFDRPLIEVVMRMECAGVKVDRAWLVTLSERFEKEMKLLERDIYTLAGREFTIASPKQLGEVLFDELNLGKGKKTGKSDAYVTDAETLEELALLHELPAKVLSWRQLSKLKSTYTDALIRQINPQTKRVHTSYALALTATGRLSSSDPNLQNIPIRTEQGRLIRHAFVAEEGFTLMSADYSQIELRLLAHMADIAPLKEAFAAGRDIHAATASQMFGVVLEGVDGEMRRKAKTINFGIIYGISSHGLATRLGISRGQAADYITTYFAQYPGIQAYMEQCKAQARAMGYVTTIAGRRCHTPYINDKQPNRRAFAERAAINAPLQGTAADIIRAAMIAVDTMLQREQSRSRMLLQVHDELVFEIAAGEESLIPRIARLMERVAPSNIPLVVETGIGAHWGEAH